MRPKGTEKCFDVSRSVPGATIILYSCHGLRGNQEFMYHPVSAPTPHSVPFYRLTPAVVPKRTKQILHQISGQCVETSIVRKELFMNPCDPNKLEQKWKIENVNLEMIKKDFGF